MRYRCDSGHEYGFMVPYCSECVNAGYTGRYPVHEVHEVKDDKFKVGDFVRVTSHSFIQGWYGKVIAIRPKANFRIGVEFALLHHGLQDCAGLAKPKHGDWFNESDLELVE